MLPEAVLLQAQQEMLDWQGTGMSVMELGHRGEAFQRVAAETESDLRDILAVPAHYKLLFLAGGASTQFAMVPLNLLANNSAADYIDTGIWSKKAIGEARRYGDVNIASQRVTRDGWAAIPPQAEWSLNPKAAYVHYTANETIEGIAFPYIPTTGDVPLVVDMTSSILSAPLDVSRFGIIYAGAQKNLGQAGITLVIVREDLIRDPLPFTPTLFSYKVEAENHSFYNTPPTYAWYMMGLVAKWVKREGGLAEFAKRTQRKSTKLYSYIDSNADFYRNTVHPTYRSCINIPFNLVNEALTETFLIEAAAAGLTNLKGHKLAGGIRASMYNAMPEAGVDALVTFMQAFALKYG